MIICRPWSRLRPLSERHHLRLLRPSMASHLPGEGHDPVKERGGKEKAWEFKLVERAPRPSQW